MNKVFFFFPMQYTCTDLRTALHICIRRECAYVLRKLKRQVVRRDGVTCMESVGLGFCLKLPILWGESPHTSSRVTEQKKHRLKQRHTALVAQFSALN